METIYNVGLEQPMKITPKPSKVSQGTKGHGTGEVKKGKIEEPMKPLEPKQIQIQK